MTPDPNEMAVSLCATLRANVDNDQLSDTEFRQFVRNSLPLTEPNGQMTKEARLFLALRIACNKGDIKLDGPPNTVISSGIQSLISEGYTEKARKAEELAQAFKRERQR